MTGASIVSAVIDQTGTDASRATVLSLLNEKYGEMCSKSRWLLETISLGNTVAGTADYSLPDTVIELLSLRAGSYRFGEIGAKDYWDYLAQGAGTWDGRRGVYAPTYSSSGGTSVSIWPTPDVSGTAITALASVQPADLTDSGASTPAVPGDVHGALIDGASSLVLSRVDERSDLAVPFEQRFQEAVERLRRRKNSRVGSGSGMQAQIKNVHWSDG